MHSVKQADSLVYQTEKQLTELGDKVPADVKSKVESQITSLKETAAGDDTDATKKAIEDLQKEVRSDLHYLTFSEAAVARTSYCTDLSCKCVSSSRADVIWAVNAMVHARHAEHGFARPAMRRHKAVKWQLMAVLHLPSCQDCDSSYTSCLDMASPSMGRISGCLHLQLGCRRTLPPGRYNL